jgi:hypothetical protein
MARILKSLKDNTAPAPATLSAAATPAPAESDVDEKRERVAEHYYLASDGAVLGDDAGEESAEGYRYVLIGVSDPLDWKWDEANESERKMFAVFGAKTLATNESSQLRNNKKKADSEKTAAAQMQAVKDRFALIRGGQWVDRTREGGPRIDLDVQAQAIVAIKIRDGKANAADGDKLVAETRIKLNDPEYLKKSRSVPAVTEKYNELRGVATVSVNDL